MRTRVEIAREEMARAYQLQQARAFVAGLPCKCPRCGAATEYPDAEGLERRARVGVRLELCWACLLT